MDWSQFGLDRQPFRPTVEPGAYFSSPTHESALGEIAGAFARRDPIVLIDGAPGVGKTLIARKWLEHLLPDVPRVVVPAARAERPTELLQAILFDLGTPYVGLSEQELRLAATGHLLDAAAAGGFPTVLLLDEAHLLGPAAFEELRLLGNLETRRGAAVFAVLVAQPAIREALSRPGGEAFAQRVGSRATIDALTAEQSTQYLQYRVRAAGGEPDKVFDSDAVAQLAGACRGVPRLLNRAALLTLELAGASGASQADVEAALEALDRIGLSAAEPAGPAELSQPVLLPHPARGAKTTAPRRGKTVRAAEAGEAAGSRGSKEKLSRKRSA